MSADVTMGQRPDMCSCETLCASQHEELGAKRSRSEGFSTIVPVSLNHKTLIRRRTREARVLGLRVHVSLPIHRSGPSLTPVRGRAREAHVPGRSEPSAIVVTLDPQQVLLH